MAGTRVFTDKYAAAFAVIALWLWALWFAIAHLGLTRFFRRRLGPDDAPIYLAFALLFTILWALRATQRYFLRSRRRRARIATQK